MKLFYRMVWALLAALLLSACDGPKHLAIPSGATVLVLGDSISYGTGAGKGEDYPSLLAVKTGWKIINAGIPGDTTTGGLQRLPVLLEKHSPQLLMIELGGNDFLRRVPLANTSANLRAMVHQAKASNTPVVLLAVPLPNLLGAAFGNLSDEPIYEEIAEETQTPLVSGVLSDILSKGELKSDQIHPNAEGYRLIAERLAHALRELGFVS